MISYNYETMQVMDKVRRREAITEDEAAALLSAMETLAIEVAALHDSMSNIYYRAEATRVTAAKHCNYGGAEQTLFI